MGASPGRNPKKGEDSGIIPTMSTSAGQDRTALVVEDDEDMRSLIELTLSTQGFDVMAVESGLDGVEAVRNHNPDLVTLDLGLPGIDGIAVLRRLRSHESTRDIPVIFSTSATLDEEDRHTIEGAGAEILSKDLLTRPNILEVIKRLTDKS